MSAPAIWIILPLAVSVLLWIPRRGQAVTLLGGLSALLLAGMAWLVPFDTALRFGPLSLKITPSLQILGRQFLLDAASQPLLTLIYGLAALWFFGAETAGVARQLIPLGMGIIALLVASLAVEPFLYAALLIEIAVLLAVPLLSPPRQKPAGGLVRFLIYQTLAMPFILFAGWLLPGVEASPGDLALAVQSATMLGLGFAFLLAIFPLYSWIPMLIEETSPYVLGFILWILPMVTVLFGTGFLDQYTWLRTSSQLPAVLRFGGLLMVVTGGAWAAFQRHLGRMLGYAAITETGFSLLALSLAPQTGIDLLFMLLIPRALGLAIWALSLSVLQAQVTPPRFGAVQGMARVYPLAAAGLILAHLSTAGFPLLAGFPIRLALWESLAHQSLSTAFWFLIGILGLLTGAIRTTAVLVMAPENTAWESRESRTQRILIGLGVMALFILGLFPQAVQPWLADLPAMFVHLGR